MSQKRLAFPRVLQHPYFADKIQMPSGTIIYRATACRSFDARMPRNADASQLLKDWKLFPNQDAMFTEVLDDGTIYVGIADGASSYTGSEYASLSILETAAALDPFSYGLIQILEEANRVTWHKLSKSYYPKACSTALIATIQQQDQGCYQISVAWVGDSRLFVIRPSSYRGSYTYMERVTTDDSYLWNLVRNGQMDPGRAEWIDQAEVKGHLSFGDLQLFFSQAGTELLPSAKPLIHFESILVEAGTTVVLATDGITDNLILKRMEESLAGNSKHPALGLVLESQNYALSYEGAAAQAYDMHATNYNDLGDENAIRAKPDDMSDMVITTSPSGASRSSRVPRSFPGVAVTSSSSSRSRTPFTNPRVPAIAARASRASLRETTSRVPVVRPSTGTSSTVRPPGRKGSAVNNTASMTRGPSPGAPSRAREAATPTRKGGLLSLLGIGKRGATAAHTLGTMLENKEVLPGYIVWLQLDVPTLAEILGWTATEQIAVLAIYVGKDRQSFSCETNPVSPETSILDASQEDIDLGQRCADSYQDEGIQQTRRLFLS